jgi:dTDP-4-dehydrorhamnose 3,5-epimerase
MAQVVCESTTISGLFVMKPPVFTDQRGSFSKVFSEELFKANGFETDLKESYYTFSQKGVIRGMHFQVPPYQHAKVVYVPTGEITDVVLDVRKNSTTYGKFETFKLTPENGIVLYIPPGLAHGFESLQDQTCVTYLQTSSYAPQHDSGIRFDSFGMKWQSTNPIISERDVLFPALSDYITPFT